MADYTSSSLGNFSYPESSGMKFNYIDSVITTWTTYDPNATAYLFSLWYHLDSRTQPWTLSINQTAPANGTKEFPLDVASKPYIGQWNLNYTAADGSLHKFLSPLFQVHHDSTQPSPVKWNQQALSPNASPTTSQGSVGTTALPTSKSSVASLTTSNSASVSNLSPASLVSSSIPSASSAAKDSSMSGGTIAGIVVATILGIALGSFLFGLLWFRRRKPGKRAESEVLPPPLLNPPSLQEADGRSRPENELSGDRDQWELPTHRH